MSGAFSDSREREGRDESAEKETQQEEMTFARRDPQP
jgi:hypothetical protein